MLDMPKPPHDASPWDEQGKPPAQFIDSVRPVGALSGSFFESDAFGVSIL